MMCKIRIILMLALLFGAGSTLLAQGQQYEGPDDPAGDKAAEREGYMTGNRVFLYFQNTTELSKWVDGVGPPLWSRWPNNDDGVRMLDGVGLLIGARVYVENDTVPVTDPVDIMSTPGLDTLYFLQTSYREEMDTDPLGLVEWGLYPVFGYFNEASEYPAMSNLPQSWPTMGWPAQGTSTKWPGEWNGRFGRGIIYADLETYFVANDANDQEYLGPEDRAKYYPRPGVFIGDKLTNSIEQQNGLPWGGIGVRVSQRGFQWNNPQARDAIFWEYSIANISDYDLPEVAFGYWVDNGIGGEADDELGFFDRQIDMAYSWDVDGTGRGGLNTGVMGFAYLESPGIPYDDIDNDQDGLLNEQRDNVATALVGPTEGIDDLDKFLAFYNLKLEDLREHWDADEDQDWDDGNDLNGDGIYQSNEFPGDDVGLDGVGPLELNYTGPDADGTEGNHRPDYVQGIGAEPDFAATDVSESDMVGLTSFRLFPVPSHSSSYRWFRGDRSMWELIGQDSTLEFLGNISNLIETFASGPFPLFQGREERISMSELHAYDELSGLNSDAHTAPALYEQKRIVQVIYESDYRFAQPPRMPTLTATAADGKVILTWDDIADKRTRDPFVGNINDFEGYKVYRATDKRFSDAEVITDGFGTPFIKKPIFQCDLKNGRLGFTDYGLVNGVGYNLGFDSGIVHHFIDENVENGRTYYYALVAYDFGAPDIGPGIAPSENTIIVDLNEQDQVRAIGQNVAIVVPRPNASGYVPPTVDDVEMEGLIGSGYVDAQILANNSLKPNHTYMVKFGIDTIAALSSVPNALIYTTNSLHVYDVTSSSELVYEDVPTSFAFNNITLVEEVEPGTTDTLRYATLRVADTISTDVFDGMRLNVYQPRERAAFDAQNSGWLVGDNPRLNISPAAQEIRYYPWDFDIVFTNDDSAYVSQSSRRNLRDENNETVSRDFLLFQLPFNFYVQNSTFMDTTGSFEKMEMVVHDLNLNGTFEILEDRILVGPLDNRGRFATTAFALDFQSFADSASLPQPGDVFSVKFQRPFWHTDSVSFKVNPEGELNTRLISSSMDNIRVVPNPYVVTNAFEEAVVNKFLNQPRRLMFTNLPAQCTIKIFTVSGVLIDEIEVNNPNDNGIIHWDMLTSEGLEIAAGIYLYHVKAERTGDTKLGKFAVVK